MTRSPASAARRAAPTLPARGALALAALIARAGPAAAQEPDEWAGLILIAPGDIVAANISSHTISVYDGETGRSRGVAVEAGGGGLRNPTGIAFGPEGAMYVASSGSSSILRFDAEVGSFLDVFASGEPLAQPFSILFGPGGDLFVSDGPRVLRYAPDGSLRGVAAEDSGLVQPIGLAFGSDGLLYVANSTAQRVTRFDPDTGRRVDDFATLPDEGVPMGLVFRGERLVIGDFGKSRLFFLDSTDGSVEPREVANMNLHGPENLAVRPGGD